MQIWTERYRPSTFNEIMGQNKIVERVAGMVREKNINNLLFAGPAGTGKSTIAIVIAKELFGKSWKENFLEKNASDERGIDVIRNEIKMYSQTKSMVGVPFKIIFLDEADSLTKEAQNALRRMMETYSNNVRYILSCNYSSKIIDPIASRCSVFHFRPLEKDDLKNVIKKISKEENLKMDDKAMGAIYDLSEGDVRRAINILQSSSVIRKDIDEKLIYDLVSFAEPKEIREVLNLSVDGNFIRSREKLLEAMLKHGLSGLDAIKQIQKEILKLEIDDIKKAKMIERCGEVEFRMVEGSDEFLQLEALLASFSIIR